jgi:hypothetical protein
MSSFVHLITNEALHVVLPKQESFLNDLNEDAPHPNDIQFAQLVRRTFSNEPFPVRHHIRPEEPLTHFAQRISSLKDADLDGTPYFCLNAYHFGAAALATIRLLENKTAALEHEIKESRRASTNAHNQNNTLRDQLRAARHERDLFERNLRAAETVVEEWEDVGRTILPGTELPQASQILEAWEDLADQNQTLKDQTNLEPILSVFPRELFLQTARTPTRLAPVIASYLAPLQRLAQQTMSRLTMIFPDGVTNPSDFWNMLDPAWRQGRDVPTTAEEARDFITSVLTQPPPSATAPCTHPQELASTILLPSGSSWDDCLHEAENLLHRANAPPPVPTSGSLSAPAPQRDDLFKVSDVPKFTKRAEYDTYRSQLRRFFDSIPEPRPDQFGMALNRIISSWDATDVRSAALDWDVGRILTYTYIDPATDRPVSRPRTWEELKIKFISSCDAMFLEVTATEDAIKALNNTRPKPGQGPMDFLLDFEAAVARRNNMARVNNMPVLSDTEITAQLLRVLPSAVRDELRKTFMTRPGATGVNAPENYTVAELRQSLVYIWTYTKASVPAKNGGHNGNSAPRRSAAPSVTPEVKDRSCGLRCSYDSPAPAVPGNLRGPIYDKPSFDDAQRRAALRRNSDCRAADVCEACRRPRSAHPRGSTFKGVRAWGNTPRALPAPASPGEIMAVRATLPPPPPRVDEEVD